MDRYNVRHANKIALARTRLRDAENEVSMWIERAGPFPPYDPVYIPFLQAAGRRVNVRRATLNRLLHGTVRERQEQERGTQQTLNLQGGGSGRLLGEF